MKSSPSRRRLTPTRQSKFSFSEGCQNLNTFLWFYLAIRYSYMPASFKYALKSSAIRLVSVVANTLPPFLISFLPRDKIMNLTGIGPTFLFPKVGPWENGRTNTSGSTSPGGTDYLLHYLRALFNFRFTWRSGNMVFDLPFFSNSAYLSRTIVHGARQSEPEFYQRFSRSIAVGTCLPVEAWLRAIRL